MLHWQLINNRGAALISRSCPSSISQAGVNPRLHLCSSVDHTSLRGAGQRAGESKSSTGVSCSLPHEKKKTLAPQPHKWLFHKSFLIFLAGGGLFSFPDPCVYVHIAYWVKIRQTARRAVLNDKTCQLAAAVSLFHLFNHKRLQCWLIYCSLWPKLTPNLINYTWLNKEIRVQHLGNNLNGFLRLISFV